MYTFICAYCGKEYERIGNSKKQNHHFCSADCYHKFYKAIHKNTIYYEKDYAYMLIKKDNVTKKVLFDIEDVEKIKEFTWHLHLRKKDDRYDVCTNMYKKKNRYLIMTRYIMNCPKGLQVDHINRNTLDNRKQNLRIVNAFENNLNRNNNTSGCVGVTYDKSRNKWQAYCKGKFLGRFNDLNDAIQCRKSFISKNFSILTSHKIIHQEYTQD